MYTEVMNQLQHWLEGNSQPGTFLLISGGSAARVFAPIWQTLSQKQQDNYTISLVDERYGPVGHADSNWTLLQQLGVDLSAPRHVPVLTGVADMAGTAAAWQLRLHAALDTNERVVALFGVGVDHHIAGIKPGSPAAHETQQFVCSYAWEDYQRITIAPPFFDNITDALLYAEGQEKYSVIAGLDGNANPVQFPSQFIKRCQSFTIYYVAE